MKLYEAKIKARQEVKEVLEKYNFTVEQIKDYVAKHPKLNDPMRKIPHHHGIGTAANFIAMVAPRIKKTKKVAVAA